MTIPIYPIGEMIPLEAQGTWPQAPHVLDRATAWALRAAEAAGRPLLLRGVPGSGKSHTARAAAAAAGRLFLSVVIDSRSEAQDLLWRLDSVGRLSDAHAPQGKAHPAADYVTPGPLWWAFDPESAARQWKRRPQGAPPETPKDWQPEKGAVLLLDEIDKADPDLPNAFLELLGNQGFSVPVLGQRVVRGATPPLVIITTNEERDLPDAFKRRCFAHVLTPPQSYQEFGKQHLLFRRLTLPDELLAEAEAAIREDHDKSARSGHYAPGLAEFLDLIISVAELESDPDKQRALLNENKNYVLGKGKPLR